MFLKISLLPQLKISSKVYVHDKKGKQKDGRKEGDRPLEAGNITFL
jgi:hypothetical protein